jgi:hypothetical protein
VNATRQTNLISVSAVVLSAIFVDKFVGFFSSEGHSGARPAADAGQVDQEEGETVGPAGSVFVDVLLHDIGTGSLGRSNSDVLGHPEGGHSADGLAVELTFEDLVELHEDSSHELLESLCLFFLVSDITVARNIFDTFIFVLAGKFGIVEGL